MFKVVTKITCLRVVNATQLLHANLTSYNHLESMVWWPERVRRGERVKKGLPLKCHEMVIRFVASHPLSPVKRLGTSQ